MVRVKPQGLVKGQEWRKGSVIHTHRYISYDVKVDNKVLRRNRVHLKAEKQGNAPNMPSDAQKTKEQPVAPAQKSAHLTSAKQTPKTTKTAEPAKKMELITAKRTLTFGTLSKSACTILSVE